MPKKFKAVLFDMDGVIVDTMPYHFIAWFEALRPLGIRVNCFEVYTREGERWEKTLKELLKRGGINPTEEKMREVFLLRQKIFRRYFKRFVFPGAQGFIRGLKDQGYLLGLVTGTPRQGIEDILPVNILRLFDTVVSGDSVRQGKPHPESYLKAAMNLGLSPKECLVIENAPLGILSAKRAKMFCVAVTTSLPAEYLKRADIAVDSLLDAGAVIERSVE